MQINYVANGMGAQSMYLLYLAREKRIPATISITADTGWENDCDLFDGTKTTAKEFYETHIKPFAGHVDTYFVRSIEGDGKPLLAIPDYLKAKGEAALVPMFGSDGGRLNQNCTDRWKARAMRQTIRRLGATQGRSAQGIHWGERARRVKGVYIGTEDGFAIYHDSRMNKKTKKVTIVKWLSHYYPLVDMQMTRADIKAECDRIGIPYLISSECSGCPHADPWRWLRRKPETIEAVADLEASLGNDYFFTDKRRPLREVIAEFRLAKDSQGDLFDSTGFDCTGGLCGI